MVDPVNGLLAARMDPERRRRIGNALMAQQYDRATPQDAAVTERAGLFPLATYANGQTGIAWPGLIATPFEKMAQVLRGEITPGTPEFNEAGFDIAGAAMVGGLAAARPRNSVGTFAGRRAQTADQAALAKAEEMTAQGVPREQIWTETGWFRAPDGKWKWEIDDSGAAARGDDQARTFATALRHRDLFAAYPDMRRTRFSSSFDGGGSFTNKGLFSRDGIEAHPGDTSTMIHEAQHGIQARERFGQGGDPIHLALDAQFGTGLRGKLNAVRTMVSNRSTDIDVSPRAADVGLDQYNRLAGEVEARAVQKRMDMTPEQRRSRPPWLDYDVPEANQIVNLYANARPGAALGAGLSGASERQGIRAYHGSPHDFDRFDMSKIGTGEGAQAYGHGLYFAEKEGVAKSYRDTTSGRNANVAVQTNGVRQLIGMLQNDPPKLEQALRATAAHMEATGTDTGRVAAKEAIAVADSIRDGTFNAGSGRMYEVNIKANPDDFLDWDKPLSQQSEKVRGALPPTPEDVTGMQLINQLEQMVRAQQPRTMADASFSKFNQDTSQAKKLITDRLRDAGIPGIKYLDQGSRNAGEGSRNYVVFDANLIEILRKYGLLGMLGAGGMAQELMKPSTPNIPDDAT